MAKMKQCPQCGKYVPEDRTYCMNCGITLGIRCPDCRAVMPVGAKVCTGCGHSFVKKKKMLSIPLWDWMKKNARPLVPGLVLLLTVFFLVAAAFPGASLAVTLDGTPFLDYTASGYDHHFGKPTAGEGLEDPGSAALHSSSSNPTGGRRISSSF